MTLHLLEQEVSPNPELSRDDGGLSPERAIAIWELFDDIANLQERWGVVSPEPSSTILALGAFAEYALLKDAVSDEAVILYYEHKSASRDLEASQEKVDRDTAEHVNDTVVSLDTWRALKGRGVLNQGNIISETTSSLYDERDAALKRYKDNIDLAGGHKDAYFDAYIDVALADMQAHEAAKYQHTPFPVPLRN